jgi:hypothetical protein
MAKHRYLVYLIVSYITVLAIPSVLKEGNSGFNISNSFFSLFLFSCIFYFLIKIYSRKYNTKQKIVAAIIGFLFDLFLNLGTQWSKNKEIHFFDLFNWINIIAMMPLFVGILLFLYGVAIPGVKKLPDLSWPKWLVNVMDNHKYSWLWAFLLIFMAWIPVLLSTYPSNYVYDAGYQLSEYHFHHITLHHPYIHTKLMGIFTFGIGHNLFHNEQIGLFLYTLFQMAWLALALSMIIRYMKLHNTKRWIRLATLALFMFSPFISVLAISATKNIPYSAAFIMFILLLLSMNEDIKKWSSIKYLTMLTVCGFISAIFENQGIYVVMGGVVVSLLFYRHHIKQLLIVTLVILGMYTIYSKPLMNKLHAYENANDRTVEMINVPIMQLANVAADHQSNLTKEQRARIQAYIPSYMEYRRGIQDCSDIYKWSFNIGLYNSNKKQFWKLWIRAGLQNINNYIDAFCKLTMGYWYPDMNFPDKNSWKDYLEFTKTRLPANNKSTAWYRITCQPIKGFDWLNNHLSIFCDTINTQKIPVVSVLLSVGFNVWLLIVFCGWILLHRKYTFGITACLLLCFLGTLLLGPVTLYRYALPIVLINPLLVSIMLSDDSPDKINSTSNR